jgi:methionyl-tRNA formyltransferase
VKTWAAERGLPVVQPGSLRKEPGAVERLRALKPDVVVVAAYGLILPQAVLDAAPHGCLNVHASLLPKYRGAAPIPAAILNGDAETGVTIMRMDAGVDTGPILAQAREPIRPDDTALTLGARLADLGARLMVETLPRVLRGEIAPIAQDESQATLSPKIDKQSGRIDWSKPAVEIDRLIRAYTPWPGAFTQWSGMDLKIVRASVNEYATNTALALRAARCKCQRINESTNQ